jgi:transposase
MVDLSKDKDILRVLYKTCRTLPDKERYHALYVISLGYPISEVANIFCKDEDTIRGWISKWTKEGNIKDKPKEGRPNDDKLEETIVKLVDENKPNKYGMNCSFWDCIELHKFFLMNGIYVSRETIRRILKKHGFRYVKADYEYALADEGEKLQFLQELSRIIDNREAGSTLLFHDEMGTLLHPKKGYIWTRKKKAFVKTYSSHRKVSAFGAVNPLTGNNEVMLTSGRTDENKFIKFLDRIYRRFKGVIYLFLDSFRVHKSKLVGEWLQLHPRMKLVFLPKYSPDLNLVEWLWNYSRKKFLNSRGFKSTRQLMSAFSWFIRRLSKSTIRRVCNIDILVNRIT